MIRIAAIIVTYNRKDKLLQCIDAVRKQTAEVQPDIIVVDNNSSDGTGQALNEYTSRMVTALPVNESGRAANENIRMSCENALAGAEDNTRPGFAGTQTYNCNSDVDAVEMDETPDTGDRLIYNIPGSNNRIMYNNLGYNSGGAGGFTWGIRKAVEDGYDYLWLMDDDCIPDEYALEEYISFAASQNDDWGYLSGKTLWKDGSICEMNVQREIWNRDLRDFEHGAKRIEMASFVSLFLPARVVRDVGLPLRKFFLWTDDWEYTRRISRKYPCWYIPGSVAVHMCDANTGADISAAPGERVDRFRYLYRNDVYLYRREGLRGAAYEAARLIVHTARIAKSDYDVREKLHRIGIMLGGTADGLHFFPEPERVNPEPSGYTEK